jgi:hypothetical protein
MAVSAANILPACLPACLLACLPACLPACPTSLSSRCLIADTKSSSFETFLKPEDHIMANGRHTDQGGQVDEFIKANCQLNCLLAVAKILSLRGALHWCSGLKQKVHQR